MPNKSNPRASQKNASKRASGATKTSAKAQSSRGKQIKPAQKGAAKKK